jgi:hypothetical protein
MKSYRSASTGFAALQDQVSGTISLIIIRTWMLSHYVCSQISHHICSAGQAKLCHCNWFCKVLYTSMFEFHWQPTVVTK